MKILVSAAACIPFGKSEGGAGWNAVLRLSEEYEVYVLTDRAHAPAWQRAQEKGGVPGNVSVRFVGSGAPLPKNAFLARNMLWVRYLHFTRNLLAAAENWHAEENFTLAHQITYASWRVPSPLWRLPIPFVWGPIGGASRFPRSFLRILSWEAVGFEFIREVQTIMTLRSKKFQNCVHYCDAVIAANRETLEFLEPHRKGRAIFETPVVSVNQQRVDDFTAAPAGKSKPGEPLCLTAGGIIEGRKGVSVALEALALVKARGHSFRYLVTGGGPEVPKLEKQTQRLGLEKEVEFHPGLSRPDYVANLQRSDIYFLPSLRETTPMALIEAILAGCLPVVADISGGGEVARRAGVPGVPVQNPKQLALGLADRICHFAINREEMHLAAALARETTIQEYWHENYMKTVREAYMAALANNQSLKQ